MTHSIRFLTISGVYTDRATPDPIPNSEVKPVRADGTVLLYRVEE